ncbi:MAG: ABC-2 family transporter protein [bacterium]|nr:ABC-2 family transporter protein [bacterium]
MRQRARLFSHVASVEARKAMSYRADFWINVVVSFFAQLGVVWYLWEAIFRSTGQALIGGWDLPSMLQYYVLVILCGKLVRGQEMMAGLSQDIYDGGLSRYLLYPVDYWSVKYAQHVGALLPALVQLVLFMALMPLFSGSIGAFRPGPAELAMGAIALAAGNLLYFLLLLPIQAVAFWADNVWSLAVLVRFGSGLLGGALLPLSLFPDEARAVLDLLPFRFLFDFPVSALMGRLAFGEWAAGMGLIGLWCGLLWALSRLVWRRGELSYTGVGI